MVAFRADAPGDYTGIFELYSDAANGVPTMEMVARVIEAPDTVTVRTSPPGTPFEVDHNGDGKVLTYNDTTVFTVVSGAPANSSQIQEGTAIEVAATESTFRNGVAWEFHRWQPEVTHTFTSTAGASQSEWVAEYVSRPRTRRPVADPDLLVASPCAFEPPVDVSFGPWLRVSEAKLSLPWLDDGEESGFQVEGDLFMSLDGVVGSLTSSRVLVNAPTHEGLELLEITPSSWNLDIDTGGSFSLGALTPGLQVLNASVNPPAALHILADLTSENRRTSLEVETFDELPLYPGILALRPGRVVFETNVETNNAQARFAIGEGSLRALRHPFIQELWLINRNLAFELAAEIAPITFNQRTQLANLGLVRLYTDQASVIRPVFENGSLGLEANALNLELFRSGQFIDTDVAVDAIAGFRFDGDLPFGGINAGPVIVKPSTDAEVTTTLVADPLQGRLAITVPPMSLDSASGLWPPKTVMTGDSRTFDTANMTVRLPCPEATLTSPTSKCPMLPISMRITTSSSRVRRTPAASG